jgi:hypothetical protein
MRHQPLSKPEQRTNSILRWRRIGVIAWLAYVWIILTWVLVCFPMSRAQRGPTRTTYGLLRWQVVTNWNQQTGIATVFPIGTTGRTKLRPAALFVTTVTVLGLTAFLAAYGQRWLRNLTPRWRCQSCGYIITGGFPRLNVCPECGELPNLHQDAWAFWR